MGTLNYTTKTLLDDAIPEMWAPGLVADAVKKSFFANLTHEKARGFMPITERTDFSKGDGDKMHFQTLSQVYSRGVTGNSTLQGNETQMAISTYSLEVEWVRNAIAYSERASLEVNFEVVQTIRELLSSWASRRIDDDILLALLDSANLGTNLTQIWGGDATGMADLASGDELTISVLERNRLALIRKGAIPIGNQTIEGVSTPLYGVGIDEVSEYRLSQDSEFDNARQYARERAKTNPIWAGAVYFIRGLILYPYYSVVSDCDQGTPIRPETILSTGINDSVTTIAAGTSGDKKDYLQNFDDASGADANYMQIEDEIITYDGDGIASDATGNRYQFAAGAGMTRGAGGTVAASHSAGALITQKQASRLIAFGAHIAARGWGMKPEPITQDYDYGFERGLGVKMIFGQTPVYRRDSKIPNYLVCTVYASNPNTNI